ncbi:MAG: superoxide dismutase [Bacteroidales bacterium]|nr:superoxide dismutase [Bacteroidales bacterium]
MNFTLPPLPYATDALEPFLSKRTVEYHYGKHHAAYIENTNKYVRDTHFQNSNNLEELVLHADGILFNNAAQAWNHTFYWHCFSPTGGGMPTGTLANRIDRDFGSFDEFKTKFAIAATSLFGSGWVWLVEKTDGKLEILPTANAENPLRFERNPILTCDVWEHAYYLDKQNRRAEYVNEFWDKVDWKAAEKRLKH